MLLGTKLLVAKGVAPDSSERDVGLLARVVHLNSLVTQILDGVAARAGITMADYLVLAVIRRSPGHRSAPTRICERLGRTTGGMTLTLDRLEAAGWLERSQDAHDRRRVVVELTPDGLDLATGINEALHRWEQSLGLGTRRGAHVAEVIDELIELFAAHPAPPKTAGTGRVRMAR
jgi:DNA-binding MarR family transcriptional regulator